MTKIDIISGFLGAGKTTLIRKLIQEAFAGQQIVLIENEFGEIGIDGGFLKDAGVNITEMNSGCICCSLVGDFGEALKKVMDQFAPDRIIIEPSGVGKLSEVRQAVENVAKECDITVNSLVTVADAMKVKMYMKNFGEFYNNQVESAGTIVLSRTQKITQEKLDEILVMLREKNDKATIITTPWDDLDGKKILEAMENSVSLANELKAEMEEEEHEHHHHHHDDDDDDDEDEHEHHHHHHDHDHHHHHHHDGHHHADEVFDSFGYETTKKFSPDFIKECLEKLGEFGEYGQVLRAKGIVEAEDGQWIHFDYVPGEPDVRYGSAEVTGRIVVIGAGVEEDAIKELFGI